MSAIPAQLLVSDTNVLCVQTSIYAKSVKQHQAMITHSLKLNTQDILPLKFLPSLMIKRMLLKLTAKRFHYLDSKKALISSEDYLDKTEEDLKNVDKPLIDAEITLKNSQKT